VTLLIWPIPRFLSQRGRAPQLIRCYHVRETRHKRAIIPERTSLPPLKRDQTCLLVTQVMKDGAGVVQLYRPPTRGASMPGRASDARCKLLFVRAMAALDLVGVGATLHNFRYLCAEFTLDVSQTFCAATIFDRSCSSAAIASVTFAPYSIAIAVTRGDALCRESWSFCGAGRHEFVWRRATLFKLRGESHVLFFVVPRKENRMVFDGQH